MVRVYALFFLLFYLPHYSVLTVTANIHDKGDKKKKKWNEIQKRKKKNTQHNKEFINTKTKTKNHNQNETKRNQPSKCSILAWAHTCIHRRRNIHTAHYGTVRHSTVQHQHSTAQLCSEASLIVRQSQIYVSNTLGQREPRHKWIKRNKKVNVCLCFCVFVFLSSS